MSSRIKALLITAAPFVLSVLLLVALSLAEGQIESLQVERLHHDWQCNVRQELHRIRASHTIDSQLEIMGVQLESFILDDLKHSGKRSLSDLNILERAFKKAYPPSHRPAGVVLVAFGCDSTGCFTPLPHPSFPRMKVKLMAELMDFYRSAAEGGNIDSKSYKNIASKNSLLFGRETPAKVIAGREGRITPIINDGKRSLLMWRAINYGKTITGGVLIIWPDIFSNSTMPLRYALLKADKAAGGSFHTFLSPIHSASNKAKPIFAPSTKVFIKSRPQTFRKVLPKLAEAKRGKFIIIDGLLVFREYLSPHHPYDIIAVAPNYKATSPISGFITFYRDILILLWGSVFFYILTAGRPVPISIRVTFRIVFLLIASLPLGALLIFGYLQILTETQHAIDVVETQAADTINATDIQSRQCLAAFARVAQKVFSSKTFFQNITAKNPNAVAGAALECYDTFKHHGEKLSDMLVFQLGRAGRLFTNGGQEVSGSERLDFFAGLVSKANTILFGRTPDASSSIDLNNENQRNWRAIFDALVVEARFRNTFFNMLETGHMASIGKEDVDLYLAQIFFASGTPSAYVILQAAGRDAQKAFLKDAVNRLNLQYPAFHASADISPGGCTVYFPTQNSGFWHSEAGRYLYSCMEHAAVADAQITLRHGNLLAIAAPCRSMGPMVMGSLWSLDDIYAADFQKKASLLVFALILALCAYRIAVLTTDYLVTPLESIEHTLKSVSAGDLQVRTALERQDELGELAKAFDNMIDGLKERRELGKFVSGAIDVSVKESDSAAKIVRASVLVSDIRSFTSISESHPPEEIVELLNTHMEAMSEAVLHHSGRIDEFIGDAIVAIFMAPESDLGVSSALAAAIEMNEKLDGINSERAKNGFFVYSMGIGIASGEVVAGTLSSVYRNEFVVIGAPRSRAEALENLSRRGRHSKIMLDYPALSKLTAAYDFELIPEEQAAELIGPKKVQS